MFIVWICNDIPISAISFQNGLLECIRATFSPWDQFGKWNVCIWEELKIIAEYPQRGIHREESSLCRQIYTKVHQLFWWPRLLQTSDRVWCCTSSIRCFVWKDAEKRHCWSRTYEIKTSGCNLSCIFWASLSQKLVLLRIARCYAERKSKLTSARTFSCITITGRGYKNLYVSSYFATVICSQGRKAHEIDWNSEYQSFWSGVI